jgi:putative hydrolase of the HAD superfamily
MIKAIAFDLDDTLLDTSGLLAPRATREAFEMMLNAGLQISLAECEKLRLDWIKEMSHRDVFEKLALQYGDEKTLAASKEATKIFYEPNLPESLPLLEGARENIDYLKNKYKLFLVTAGTESAQIQKAKVLGVDKDFLQIYVVNSLLKKRKKDAFLDIIEKTKIQASELFCIGNSLSSEIRDAVEINSVACYFEFGEERGSLNQANSVKPHFHIKKHSELISTCRL